MATLAAAILLPAAAAQPFPLSAIKLTGGPFLEAEKRCAAYLLEVEPDRLLHSFRKHAGLEPKGAQYGGWENSGLAGHTLGHYLTACAQEFEASGDIRYKEKADYIVAELAACQKARPDGLISAIPNGDKAWGEVKKGEIRSGGFDLNGMWSPWYTYHKQFAGLLDVHAILVNKEALEVAKRFADWAIEETKDLSPGQWQKMLVCEYGGINESFAELYARTKDRKYLELARKFYDTRVLDPLKQGKDELQGKHSNTQIPKIIGLARLYELEGQDADRKAAEFFWDRVVNHHSYAIGGNSNHEYLGPPDQLSDRLSSNTAETCNTYNMLRLSRHLFAWNPRAEVADFYERAYLNHILASQNDQGMMTYFMPLVSGGARHYSNKFQDFTCCHGSGLETHSKHGDSAYFHAGADRLWVNLFMPTKLDWKEAGVKLTQETEFPLGNKVRLIVESGQKNFELNIRHPGWAKGTLEFKVNGKAVARSEKPSSFVSIKRLWKKGDALEFDLLMQLHSEAMPDNPDRVAILYGPIVLGASLGSPQQPAPRIPVLVSGDRKLQDWLKPVAGKALEFKSEGALRPDDLVFKPFYALKTDRYAVYFDRFDEEGWKKLEAEYRAEEQRIKDLEARTVDYCRIGEMQPERDHKLKSERNDVREANGRGFRTPLAGGWFELTLKVDPEKENELVVTYWGGDRGRPEFEILIDGQLLKREDLPNRKQNKFFDETYLLGSDRTKGKTEVTVRMQAVQGSPAAAIAGMRIVRKA